jgi:hypothetical protein
LDTLPTLRANARAATYLPCDELLPALRFTQPMADTAGSNMHCATAFRSSRTAARRTSRRSVPESRGPASDGGSEVSTRRRGLRVCLPRPQSIRGDQSVQPSAAELGGHHDAAGNSP